MGHTAWAIMMFVTLMIYVHTVLVKNYNIVPKQLRGTIIPVLGASSAPRNKIVITCRVPDDAPVPLIRDALIQKFGGNYTFFD